MTKFPLLALVFAAFLVTACGETRLLSGRSAPDELSVVEGPSLALPPDFELRPPSANATQMAVPLKDEAIDARTILNKDATMAAPKAKPDAADAWLIKAAGGDKADPTIREKLSPQVIKQEEKAEKKGFFSRLNPFDDDEADAN